MGFLCKCFPDPTLHINPAVDRWKELSRSSGGHLVAEFCGNVAGALRLKPEVLDCVGAGRGISTLPNIAGVLEVT